jgi:hypothetical protein
MSASVGLEANEQNGVKKGGRPHTGSSSCIARFAFLRRVDGVSLQAVATPEEARALRQITPGQRIIYGIIKKIIKRREWARTGDLSYTSDRFDSAYNDCGLLLLGCLVGGSRQTQFKEDWTRCCTTLTQRCARGARHDRTGASTGTLGAKPLHPIVQILRDSWRVRGQSRAGMR